MDSERRTGDRPPDTQSVWVAAADDVPAGTMRRVEVAGVAVLLVNLGGILRAVSAVCTHEDESLDEGWLTDRTVVCAYHGSEFDLESGEVVAPPADRPLRTFDVRVEGRDVFLGLAGGQ